MKLHEQSITSISSIPTIIISLIVAVFIPLAYFIMACEYVSGSVNAELAFSARAVENIIMDNPATWHFEEVRLQEILKRRLDPAYRDRHKIKDLQGHVIAESNEPLTPPVLTFSQPIYDSGREVAVIEIERSIFPLVARTALVGTCSSASGIIIFLVYYFFPLRIMREAYGKLQKSERQYRLITERMTDIVWVVNMDLKVVYVTPSVQTVLGFTQEEIKNQALEEKLTPHSLSFGLEILARELAIEEQGHGDPDRAVNLVLEYYHKDGSIRWMETIMSGLRNDQGVVTGIHGVSRDITERRRVEEEARKLASIVQFSGEMVGLVTLEGKVIFINEAGSRIWGFDPDKIGDYSIMDVIPESFLQKSQQAMSDLVQGGKNWSSELQFRNIQTGVITDVHLTGFTIKDFDTGVPHYLAVIAHDITEQKKAETALKKSEEKYRQLAETTHDIIICVDFDFKITYGNNAATNFVRGLNLVGMSLLDFSPPDMRELQKAIMQKRREGYSDELSFDFEIIYPADTVTVFDTRASLLTDHGKPSGVMFIGRDVTARKKAEDALRTSEEKFASAFKNSPNVMCITLLNEGRFVDVNDVFLDTLGYHREEIIGRRSSDINLWVDDAEPEAILKEIAATGKVNDVEFRIYDKKGNIRWGLASMSLIKIAGEPHVLSQIVDITDRKLAEEKFHKIFITTPDLIGISRLKDGLITDVNKGFEDILGWKREEVIGKRSVEPPINFWVEPAERCFLTEELKAGRDILHHEIQFRRKDGSIRTGVYSARPINIADEELIIFIMQDVTEQKRMEEKLIEFQKRQLMGQITSGMAHEVRNPLHAIQAISEAMVIDLNEKSDYKEYISHIKAQVARLSRLISDLLELGKPIQSSQFSKVLLTETAAVALKKWAEAHPRLSQRIKVVNNLLPDDFVMADPDKIQQVVIHLMENAVRHSPKDGDILLEFGKASENRLIMKIMDQGEGLTAENRSRVFEPFYTTHKGSAGLGLCICKYIIENHGGKIELVNNENAPGCTAQFTLPVYNSKEPG